MIEAGKEKELRRQEYLVGYKMHLNNGDEWTVPSMPMGKASTWFAEKIEEVENMDTTDLKAFMPLGVQLIHRILQINYPGLSEDQCDGLVGMTEFRKLLLAFQGIDPDKEQDFLDLSSRLEESSPQAALKEAQVAKVAKPKRERKATKAT